MKYIMTVGPVCDEKETWEEDYSRADILTLEDAQRHAENMIESFNNTLRLNERARKLYKVVLVQEQKQSGDHFFQKQNLVTISDKDGLYDIMKCAFCPVTGRRFGFTDLTLDRKYRTKKWQKCRGEELIR